MISPLPRKRSASAMPASRGAVTRSPQAATTRSIACLSQSEACRGGSDHSLVSNSSAFVPARGPWLRTSATSRAIPFVLLIPGRPGRPLRLNLPASGAACTPGWRNLGLSGASWTVAAAGMAQGRVQPWRAVRAVRILGPVRALAGAVAVVLTFVLVPQAAGIAPLTATNLRIADHPAYVRVVLDFTGGTVQP